MSSRLPSCLAVLVVLAHLHADRPVEAAPPLPAGVDPKHVHVLMVSGGGTPNQNFRSHLSHLKQFLALVDKANVPRDHISVLAGDGADPAPDLAVLDATAEEGLWLLDRTQLQELLAPSLDLINSTLPGITLQPATQGQLTQWFQKARRKIPPGDTLLVFVTDHGNNDTKDPWQSQITLWGARAGISARQLRVLLEGFDPRVRVVTLMSQCFSGGFANLYQTHGKQGLPGGNVCGYFSSTADRPAYGCFPENVGQDAVGHAFRFFESLQAGRNFAKAHTDTLVNDDSPDVPLRTSDVFLLDLLESHAKKTNADFDDGIDAWLQKAWRDKARFEPDIRLLDAIGRSYGLFSPRSQKELAGPEQQLQEAQEQLERHGKLWDDALSDITNGNLHDFLKSKPLWNARLQPRAINVLPQSERRALASALLAELVPFTEQQAERHKRLMLVANRLDTVNEVSYRMEVRLAAMLRMRMVLANIAGRVLVETAGTEAQKKALALLTQCEQFGLGLRADEGGGEKAAPTLPSYEDDLTQAQAVFPAWLGIEFQPPADKLAARLKLPSGASLIRRVFPNSPAAKAGLRASDVVLGPPGAPFADNNQVRSWTMLSPTLQPLPLVIVRDGKSRVVNITLSPYPSELPKLPTRPKEGEHAQSLIPLESYRGQAPAKLAQGPYVLFYWATWCGPCKAAVPELMQFSTARKIPILAVTDEDRSTLDAFFAKRKQPFPDNVASDLGRTTFVTYGISATPTFILVDEQNTIVSYVRGYNREQGLPFPNWTRP
ncbi:MAG: redoxin domain-containing protein [Deltaproteobacteria bacterium]|nr:redoxin domain-containing protein [Deltaproteobacteria bacterium]